MQMQDFLSLVAPDEGYLFVAEYVKRKVTKVDLEGNEYQKDDGYFKHYPASDCEGVVELAEHLDANSPYNIFFACSSFKEQFYFNAKGKKRSRTQENVSRVKALWADIDVGCNEKGDPKPNAYATQADAVEAVSAFCAASGIPEPMIVSSGAGVHCWWPFSKSVKPETWQAMADALFAVKQRFGLKDDPSRARDCASVLRLPGTHNKKGGKSKRVKVLMEAERILSPKEFREILIPLLPEDTVPKKEAIPDYLLAGSSTTQALALVGKVEYPPSFAEEVASTCAQLEDFKKTGGRTYNEWWLSIGVLKHCEDGIEKIHEWSAHHHEYDKEHTDAKIEEWSNGPATCKAFSACNEMCSACPLFGKIKSPIQTGIREAVEEAVEVVNTTEGTVQIVMPHGFVMHNGGVCATIKTDEGVEYKPVSNIEFWFDERYREMDGSATYRCTAKVRKNDDGVWDIRHFPFPAKLIGKKGADLMSELSKFEIFPLPSKDSKFHMESYVQAMADSLRQRRKEVKVFSHFGWQEDGTFIVGNRQLMPDGATNTVMLKGDAETFMQAFPEPTTTAEQWSKVVEEMYARPHHEQFQTIVLFNLGSPLLELQGLPTGCPVNVLGRPGSGKTTAIEVGLSAWGVPRTLGTKFESTTENAAYSRLATLHSIPTLIDEMTNAPPDTMSRMMFSVANGQPRDRLKNTGERNVQMRPWYLVTNMSSNESLIDKLSGLKADASAEISRILEFSWQYPRTLDRREMDDLLYTRLPETYGAAGQAFAHWCVMNVNKARKIINKMRLLVEDEAKIDKENRFWSAHLAVPLATVYICHRYLGLLTEFDADAIMAYCLRQVREHKSGMSDWTMTPEDMFHSMITSMTNRIILTTGERDGRVGQALDIVQMNQEPAGRVVRDSGTFYLSVPAIKQWCVEHHAQYKVIKAFIMEMGYLKGEKKYYIGRGTTKPTGQIYCLELDWNKMQDISEYGMVEPVKLQRAK